MNDVRKARFPFGRGTNMSMWFAQVDVLDESHLASKYSRDDFARVAQFGADHIRLPVDHELIEEPGSPHKLRGKGIKWVEKAMDWAWKEGLGVTLDLHKTAGMSFFTPELNNIWNDVSQQERFASLWEKLALHFKGVPHDKLVYEILNEPTSADNLLWNKVAAMPLAKIRAIDPDRWIVIGSNSWNVPSTFPDLADFHDPKVAYAVHWYEPFIFTHQKAPWCEWLKMLDMTVHYPGRPGDLSKYKELLGNPAWCEQMMFFSNEELCYERMERCFSPVAEFAKKSGAPIYCSEFGCWDPAPKDSQLNWFRDSVRLFASNNVSWAQWDYGHIFKDGAVDPAVKVLFK